MYSRHMRLLVMMCAALLLAACGQEEPYTPATISMTSSPAQDLIFVGGCASADLENWLEHTDFLEMEFVRTMLDSVALPPGEVGPAIQRMGELRNAFADVPAPDECAAEVHRSISMLMENGLAAFQAYANGAAIQLQTAAADASAALTEIRSQQAQLIQRLEEQFSAERGQSGN